MSSRLAFAVSGHADHLVSARPPSDPTPALPIVDASTLAKPGTKEGDLKLVAQAGITHAYQVSSRVLPSLKRLTDSSPRSQWSTASSSWTDLGEVVDNPSSAEPAPAAAKTTFEGEEYDLVFSIDVKDDEPPLKLPYNFGDGARSLPFLRLGPTLELTLCLLPCARRYSRVGKAICSQA